MYKEERKRNEVADKFLNYRLTVMVKLFSFDPFKEEKGNPVFRNAFLEVNIECFLRVFNDTISNKFIYHNKNWINNKNYFFEERFLNYSCSVFMLYVLTLISCKTKICLFPKKIIESWGKVCKGFNPKSMKSNDITINKISFAKIILSKLYKVKSDFVYKEEVIPYVRDIIASSMENVELDKGKLIKVNKRNRTNIDVISKICDLMSSYEPGYNADYYSRTFIMSPTSGLVLYFLIYCQKHLYVINGGGLKLKEDIGNMYKKFKIWIGKRTKKLLLSKECFNYSLNILNIK